LPEPAGWKTCATAAVVRIITSGGILSPPKLFSDFRKLGLSNSSGMGGTKQI
jgi:hypothetical protein